jgi:hypothetical protein
MHFLLNRNTELDIPLFVSQLDLGLFAGSGLKLVVCNGHVACGAVLGQSSMHCWGSQVIDAN